MKITVHLHTILQRETPDGLVNRLELSLPINTTLAVLIEHLEIEMDPDSLLLAVNGRTADVDHPLEDGDLVNLMPAISGGVR